MPARRAWTRRCLPPSPRSHRSSRPRMRRGRPMGRPFCFQMLLTLTLTRPPATDLGFLLHKHPERVQEFSLPFGRAHVFYPEAGEDRCTAALLLDVDPVGLIRRGVRFARLDQYVNDRPYVASSFMSVAISRVYRSAMAGTCNERPDLPDTPLPLDVRIAVLPVAGGEELARRLFEPL